MFISLPYFEDDISPNIVFHQELSVSPNFNSSPVSTTEVQAPAIIGKGCEYFSRLATVTGNRWLARILFSLAGAVHPPF
jgi:hypothetical protein